MATLLYRLGKTAYRRWPIFLAAWLIAWWAWQVSPPPCPSR